MYHYRLNNEFFNNELSRNLRNIPGGETYTLIYLKLQLLSIEEGGILKGTGRGVVEELAEKICENHVNVQVTLTILQRWKMIEKVEDGIQVTSVKNSVISKDEAIKSEEVEEFTLSEEVKPKLEKKYLMEYLELIESILKVSRNQIEQRISISELANYNLATVIDEVKKSDFLMGKLPTARGNYVSLDHFIKSTFILRIITKQYRNRDDNEIGNKMMNNKDDKGGADYDRKVEEWFGGV